MMIKALSLPDLCCEAANSIANPCISEAIKDYDYIAGG